LYPQSPKNRKMNINKERMVEFCRDLIRIPSRPGKEKDAAERCREELVSLGFDECDCDEFGSTVGIIRNGSGPTVLLDAHIDTVGVEPVKEWQRDPFGAWVEEGKIFGRGAVDMKGPAAAMVYGIAALLEKKTLFGGTLIVSLSTLEEVCEGIALGHVIDTHGADFVIVGEPSNNKLIRGQRGRAEIVLSTYGRPAHSSTPHLGIDAVEKMIILIRKMREMELPGHPFLGTAVQALTDIISSPYPAQSIVPSQCRATFDRRLIVDENESSIAVQLHDMIEKAKAEDPSIVASAEIAKVEVTAYTGKTFTFRKFIPAWEMPEDHELVRRAGKALSEAGVTDKPPTFYRFCTNASWACVQAGKPTIGFGPGDADQAHSIDEHIDIDHLELGAKGYATIAMELMRR
jgi:putative selenium metabolism hydrolase